MNIRKPVWLLASCALAASCGGGDAAPQAPIGSVPTPAPSPSPTPSPAPAPSYTPFGQIAQDTNFKTSCAGYYRPTPGAAAVTFSDFTYGSGLQVSYRANTQTYVVAGQGFEYIFGPADRSTSADGQLEVYSPNIDRALTIGPRDAQYARSLTLLGASNGSLLQVVECVLGAPTQAGDLPQANRSFDLLFLSGSAQIDSMSYDLSGSTASVTYDLAGKAVSIRVNAVGKRTSFGPGETPNSTLYTLGQFEGTAPLTAGATSFRGTLSSPASTDVTGSFGGSLFGPAGQEVALVFKFGGSGAGGSPFAGQGRLIAGAKK
jgi:hypothetical protein